MSDSLHDLTSPAEEKKVGTNVEENKPSDTKQSDPPQIKIPQEVFDTTHQTLMKFIRLVFVLGGVLFVLTAIAFFIVEYYLPTEAIQETHESQPIEAPSLKEAVKFRRYDGGQYSFYLPESYSFVETVYTGNRKQVSFRDESGKPIFDIKEYEWSGPNDISLSNALKTYQFPNSQEQIYEETYNTETQELLKVKYSTCEDETCERELIQTGYGSSIDGIYVLIINTGLDERTFEESILKTFSARRADPKMLTADKVRETLSPDITFNEVLREFGMPEIIQDENATTLSYELSDDSIIGMGFDADGKLYTAFNEFPDAFLDLMSGNDSSITSYDAYIEVKNSRGLGDLRRSNAQLYYVVFLDQGDSTKWNVDIYDKSDQSTPLQTLKVDRTTGEIV